MARVECQLPSGYSQLEPGVGKKWDVRFFISSIEIDDGVMVDVRMCRIDNDCKYHAIDREWLV
jgi:hypothetical protein